MPFLIWGLFGLIVGAVARLALGGRTRLGCFPTLALAAGGAIMGGLLSDALGRLESPTVGWSRALAFAGAAAALGIYQYVARHRAVAPASTYPFSMVRRLHLWIQKKRARPGGQDKPPAAG
jgi:uncharacterized membrane protein YeaQ/YmgE (transglycosylase-associated protein family)